MEEFQLNTKIVSGPGAIGVLGQEKARRVFLVTDPFFVKNGMADRVVRAAGAESWEIFDGVQPDPSVELAARGTARLKAFGPDLLIALGGGSAMDCAKAMAYFSGTDAPLAAIPTTSGSGSEVTDFAVLTHGQTKYPLVDKRLQPALAILDSLTYLGIAIPAGLASDLLDELPPGLIADTGFDVLTHAVEAYTASNAGTIPDLLAQDAFRTAFACLPASYAGDKSVRLRLHMASTLAGIAFSRSGLGLCHAMAHVLGGRFHIPHGRLNAILLPAVISGNAPAVQAKYARLARAAGLGGSADTVALRNLKNGLIRLRKDLGLPQTLSQAGAPPAQVWAAAGEIVEAVLADPCCKTNPVPVEDYLVRRVLEEVTGNF